MGTHEEITRATNEIFTRTRFELSSKFYQYVSTSVRRKWEVKHRPLAIRKNRLRQYERLILFEKKEETWLRHAFRSLSRTLSSAPVSDLFVLNPNIPPRALTFARSQRCRRGLKAEMLGFTNGRYFLLLLFLLLLLLLRIPWGCSAAV